MLYIKKKNVPHFKYFKYFNRHMICYDSILLWYCISYYKCQVVSFVIHHFTSSLRMNYELYVLSIGTPCVRIILYKPVKIIIYIKGTSDVYIDMVNSYPTIQTQQSYLVYCTFYAKHSAPAKFCFCENTTIIHIDQMSSIVCYKTLWKFQKNARWS